MKLKTFLRTLWIVLLIIVLVSCNESSGGSSSSGSSNTVPSADAGPDFVAKVNSIVVLDGSKSADPNGNTLNYLWTVNKTPAESTVELSSFETMQPSFTPTYVGIYVFSLEVSNGTLKDNDIVTVVAINQSDSNPTLALTNLDGDTYAVVLISPESLQSVKLVGVHNIGLECKKFSDLKGGNAYSPTSKGFNNFQSISFSDLDGERNIAGEKLDLFRFNCSESPRFKAGNSAAIAYDNQKPIVGKERINFID